VTLPALFRRVEFLARNNSTTLLTGVGVVGTVSSAVLTGRASVKAYQMIQEDEIVRHTEIEANLSEPVTPLEFRERLALTWPQFIPPVGVGVATIAAIVMANRLSAKEAAALATAYGISERALQEYKEKVVEKLGNKQERAIRDEVAQARIEANPVSSREVILAGTGEVLCYDMFTGRYFQSTVEEIKKAENKVNFEIVNHMSASLSSFYDEIGLQPTEMSDRLGFNLDNRCEVKFSTTMTQDKQRPCVAIDFHFPPVYDYGKIYS
jgi:hypothetical protein